MLNPEVLAKGMVKGVAVTDGIPREVRVAQLCDLRGWMFDIGRILGAYYCELACKKLGPHFDLLASSGKVLVSEQLDLVGCWPSIPDSFKQKVGLGLGAPVYELKSEGVSIPGLSHSEAAYLSIMYTLQNSDLCAAVNLSKSVKSLRIQFEKAVKYWSMQGYKFNLNEHLEMLYAFEKLSFMYVVVEG